MPSDFHWVEFGSRTPRQPADQTAQPPAPSSRPKEPAQDAVLVPMDQWSRILGQLGNIHEAGQQLADARERAARAEVENEFLKERIRDLKSQLGGAPNEPEPIESEAAPEPEPETPTPSPRTVTVEMKVPEWSRRLVRRVRRRN